MAPHCRDKFFSHRRPLPPDTALSLEDRLQRLDLSSLARAARNESNLAEVPCALPSFSVPDIRTPPPPTWCIACLTRSVNLPPVTGQEEDDRMTGQRKGTIDDTDAPSPTDDDASPRTFSPH